MTLLTPSATFKRLPDLEEYVRACNVGLSEISLIQTPFGEMYQIY